MKRQTWIIFFTFFICLSGIAQKPEQLLANWSARSPIEKAYLHFDRDNYIAGETAWFKAYLYSDYQPDTISTSLYAELINDTGVVISRAIVPVLLGTANGYFELSDSITTGSYLVRTYSPTMLNQDADFTGKGSIFIYGKKNAAPAEPKEKMIRLEFFPEGGNLINGYLNTVAFKITNENGLPVAAKGNIVNEKNELVTIFSALHDGMGMFELTPAPNGKYFAVLETDAAGKKHLLPESTNKGIALTVMPHPQGNFFELKQRKEDPAFQVAYMIGQMQHHIVFKQEFKTFKEEMQGIINTKNLHSGILQITFFNKDDQPLAERLCFVNNREYFISGEIIADTVNFSPKAKNRFSVQLKDTVQGSFSVSITDPDYSLSAVRENNIISSLLLTSDLKGYVHNPAFYFSNDDDSVKTALDLVMMTNGWRRFKWTELSQKAARPGSYKDGSFITLSGKVTLRDTKKPFVEKPLLMMLMAADSTRSMQMTTTDKQGYFRLDSILLFGKSRILFSDIRGKKSMYIDVNMGADSLTRPFFLPKATLPFRRADIALGTAQKKMEVDYDAIQKAAGLMMEEVILKAKKKKSLLQELEEKYTTGQFSGDANKILDLVNADDAAAYNNIFDYLQTRVNGLQIEVNGFDYEVYYRQQASISSLGNFPMVLYLDEIETDASFISTIPANQVAMVKVYSSFTAATGNAPGGVLAIYTKKGSDMSDVMQHAADMVKYNGYSVTKEFYAPDYAVDKSEKARTDNRITLSWRPNVLINNVNPKIPLTFYNNDRTTSFKVVVEGMTLDGRMLMIEKTISRKGF
ncbi:MAG: hypothetical protein V9F01_14070 [Chitinophagaceae bacterium]